MVSGCFIDDLIETMLSCNLNQTLTLCAFSCICISDVKAWSTADMLKLSDNITKLILVTSKRAKHLHSLPTSICDAQIPLKQSVKNFGFALDCDLTMSWPMITMHMSRLLLGHVASD